MDSIINREMLIKYRRHLIPLFLFPSVAFGGIGLLPNEWTVFVLFPAFFAVTIYAALPYYTKRASFSYWMLAMGVWVSGIVPAMFVAVIVALPTSN
jgi:hypothetical protein